MKFYDAWWFLHNHSMNRTEKDINYGTYGLDIFVTKVNPVTHAVDDDRSKNTLTEIWLEYGPYENVNRDDSTLLYDNWQRTHDPRLDCGGETFEKAVIRLADLVRKYYGNN